MSQVSRCPALVHITFKPVMNSRIVKAARRCVRGTVPKQGCGGTLLCDMCYAWTPLCYTEQVPGTCLRTPPWLNCPSFLVHGAGMKIRFANLIKGLRQLGDDVMVVTPCINPPKTFHGAKVLPALAQHSVPACESSPSPMQQTLTSAHQQSSGWDLFWLAQYRGSSRCDTCLLSW